jgi:hypothetical protein
LTGSGTDWTFTPNHLDGGRTWTVVVEGAQDASANVMSRAVASFVTADSDEYIPTQNLRVG